MRHTIWQSGWPMSTALLLITSSLVADERGRLIFEDDFDRTESQEVRDEPGNGWGTNSARRAAGNKQVDLRQGAMYIYRHPVADHGVSVTHPAEFRNGSVELRFMLEHPQDSLGLNFADLEYKAVHAGHLFVAKVSPRSIQLTDLKTGNMDLKIREKRLAKDVSPELQRMLKEKSKTVKHELEVGKWYTLCVTVKDETLSLQIDGETLTTFSSPGIAHPTKRTLRLAVARNAVVDDVKIFRKDSSRP